jgi:hypothetical protein
MALERQKLDNIRHLVLDDFLSGRLSGLKINPLCEASSELVGRSVSWDRFGTRIWRGSLIPFNLT